MASLPNSASDPGALAKAAYHAANQAIILSNRSQEAVGNEVIKAV